MKKSTSSYSEFPVPIYIRMKAKANGIKNSKKAGKKAVSGISYYGFYIVNSVNSTIDYQ